MGMAVQGKKKMFVTIWNTKNTFGFAQKLFLVFVLQYESDI